MKLTNVYNAIVWTESALEFLSTGEGFAQTIEKLHSATALQIVLAPGAKSPEEIERKFASSCRPGTILCVATPPVAADKVGLPQFCADAVRSGVDRIHTFAKQKSPAAQLGPLGALIPKDAVTLASAQAARPLDEAGVLLRRSPIVAYPAAFSREDFRGRCAGRFAAPIWVVS